MNKIVFSLLLTLVISSEVAPTEDNGLKTTQWNELMEKIDNISTKPTKELSVSRTDNSVVAQLLMLTSKMATVEAQQQTTKDELQKTKNELQKTKNELQKTKNESQKTKADLHTTRNELQTTQANQEKAEADQRATKSELGLLRSRESNPGSSSFVHWGRKSCPGNTTLIYSGVAGGKQYNEKGSGTNRLCLSKKPEFDDNIKPPSWGHVYGAEYQFIQGHHDHDVPCSVCLAPESTTIMVPGTRTCPPAWTRQYHGHLASTRSDHFALEYVCLDQEPENDSSGVQNHNGNLFFYTKTKCGSLPCPPYVNLKIVTCVVCSK